MSARERILKGSRFSTATVVCGHESVTQKCLKPEAAPPSGSSGKNRSYDSFGKMPCVTNALTAPHPRTLHPSDQFSGLSASGLLGSAGGVVTLSCRGLQHLLILDERAAGLHQVCGSGGARVHCMVDPLTTA